MKNPDIRFYLINKDRKWKSYEECYSHHLAERTKYHNEYGKDGFLSERTDESFIPIRSEQEAKREWNMQNKMCGGEVKVIQIEDEKQIKEIEQLEGFVRWIKPHQIPNKGEHNLHFTKEEMLNDD